MDKKMQYQAHIPAYLQSEIEDQPLYIDQILKIAGIPITYPFESKESLLEFFDHPVSIQTLHSVITYVLLDI